MPPNSPSISPAGRKITGKCEPLHTRFYRRMVDLSPQQAGVSMARHHDGFDIESFEAGRDLWHARIRRADATPVVIDGELFNALELGIASACATADTAIAHAISHIDRFGRSYAAAG